MKIGLGLPMATLKKAYIRMMSIQRKAKWGGEKIDDIEHLHPVISEANEVHPQSISVT